VYIYCTYLVCYFPQCFRSLTRLIGITILLGLKKRICKHTHAHTHKRRPTQILLIHLENNLLGKIFHLQEQIGCFALFCFVSFDLRFAANCLDKLFQFTFNSLLDRIAFRRLTYKYSWVSFGLRYKMYTVVTFVLHFR